MPGKKEGGKGPGGGTVEYPSNLLVLCVRSGTDASHSRDAQRGLHALYSRTNAPVYHDGLALLRPGANQLLLTTRRLLTTPPL